MTSHIESVIVIPSRYQSSRFPGKPLAPIAGRSLLQRVWSIASSVQGVDQVLVATDDTRIADHVRSFGGDVVMTPEECRNGTERVSAALESQGLKPDIVINFQGDAPLVPPWILQALLDHMKKQQQCKLATPAVLLDDEKVRKCLTITRSGKIGGTYVTFTKDMKALYFSKAVIPNPQASQKQLPAVHKHLGIYAYRYESLKEYLSYEPGVLEKAETLEQLRALENGMEIDVVLVDFRGRSSWSVDNPEDVVEVEHIIEREGELCS